MTRPAPTAERRWTDAELLRAVGEYLLGSEWQRPLARRLGERRPDRGNNRPVDSRLVRRVAAGEREVPPWWWAALMGMVVDYRSRLNRHGERAEPLVEALRGRL